MDRKCMGSESAGGTPEAPANCPAETVGELKERGNVAFKKAQLLRRTTAGRQYLSEARSFYAEALTKLGHEAVDDHTLSLACTLHTNLAAVFLQDTPPQWQAAKAACDIALSVHPKQVKALYRRAQALLEGGRQGLPEASLRAALGDLNAACEVEPGNAIVASEAERIRRRIAKLEESSNVPEPTVVARRIAAPLLDRGDDLLMGCGYLWGQTKASVHVFVPVRGVRVTKSADVTCEVRVRSLTVVLPASGDASEFRLSGRLHKSVQPDECIWQLEEEGLLLHVELVKRDQTPEGEHWLCVWEGQQQTKAPSAEERREIAELARAACLADEKEKPKHPTADETVRRLRELCPGVNIEWGDTSFEDLR
mmetsp:Transcript_93245/g.216703  ORF Transcript_93245/g.216703 Transcript_93245/m.216703 type:complete len:367 (+) Transcript_93245:25-1125(+)